MATPDDREQALVELRHVHLPQLVDAGLVTHDVESGVVSAEPLDPLVEDLLEKSVEAERSSRS